jgi:hypothetical protein
MAVPRETAKRTRADPVQALSPGRKRTQKVDPPRRQPVTNDRRPRTAAKHTAPAQ